MERSKDPKQCEGTTYWYVGRSQIPSHSTWVICCSAMSCILKACNKIQSCLKWQTHSAGVCSEAVPFPASPHEVFQPLVTLLMDFHVLTGRLVHSIQPPRAGDLWFPGSSTQQTLASFSSTSTSPCSYAFRPISLSVSSPQKLHYYYFSVIYLCVCSL